MLNCYLQCIIWNSICKIRLQSNGSSLPVYSPVSTFIITDILLIDKHREIPVSGDYIIPTSPTSDECRFLLSIVFQNYNISLRIVIRTLTCRINVSSFQRFPHQSSLPFRPLQYGAVLHGSPRQVG